MLTVTGAGELGAELLLSQLLLVLPDVVTSPRPTYAYS